MYMIYLILKFACDPADSGLVMLICFVIGLSLGYIRGRHLLLN